jgi:hypothetical protein
MKLEEQTNKFKNIWKGEKDRLQAEAEALNLTLSTYIIIQLNKLV